MLGNSWVAEQLVASEEGLSSMEFVTGVWHNTGWICTIRRRKRKKKVQLEWFKKTNKLIIWKIFLLKHYVGSSTFSQRLPSPSEDCCREDIGTKDKCAMGCLHIPGISCHSYTRHIPKLHADQNTVNSLLPTMYRECDVPVMWEKLNRHPAQSQNNTF
jgi:hypothetical protein